jgi:hypothetical protein
MKDITVQVVKVKEGYQVTVVDDDKTGENPQGWKCNDLEMNVPDKTKMLEEVNTILSKIE